MKVLRLKANKAMFAIISALVLSVSGCSAGSGSGVSITGMTLSGSGCVSTDGSDYGTLFAIEVSLSNYQTNGTAYSFDIGVAPANATRESIVANGTSSNICILELSADRTKLLVKPVMAGHKIYPNLEAGGYRLKYSVLTRP